jgi:pyridoxal phosphate enzyme (YggS family)
VPLTTSPPDPIAPGGAPDRAFGGAAGPLPGIIETALARGLAEVRARIAAAGSAAGHDATPTLVAVTKSVTPEVALLLARLLSADGATAQLGENRASVLEEKATHFAGNGAPPVRWHFIGHVQRNKARRIAEIADVVHSVDSAHVARLLGDAAVARGKVLDVYLQVDLTGESNKTGAAAEMLPELARDVVAHGGLRLVGIMAMAPLVEAPGHGAREVFARAAALAQELATLPAVVDHLAGRPLGLSLGMSGDLEEAVAAGSTAVRIGSDLFTHLPTGLPPTPRSARPEDPTA